MRRGLLGYAISIMMESELNSVTIHLSAFKITSVRSLLARVVQCVARRCVRIYVKYSPGLGDESRFDSLIVDLIVKQMKNGLRSGNTFSHIQEKYF